MQESPAVLFETRALLEQTWGEYWRRSGDMLRAAQHQLKVLNMFELLGDTRQVLSTYNNLSIIYGEAKNYERAIDYARRVLSMAKHVRIDPYILSNTLLNLGANYFWLGKLDEAIEQYRRALEHSEQAGLKVIANRAHFNLAEAYYKKYQAERDPALEREGDTHAAAVLKADPTELDSFARDAAETLKAEILGPHEGATYQRLVPSEFVVHRDEMSIVQRSRTTLALPSAPREHIRAHLAIANAYLAISTKEREAALDLIRQHGLGNEFDSEIDALQMTFSRELTKEKVLLAQWKQKSYGVLTEERAATVLRQVLDVGSINKSSYATLCQVGLATASKHLGTLAERGLLVQTGKGPSTRYVLPAG
jgi:tetratricopeptide (TPR) repeat protein